MPLNTIAEWTPFAFCFGAALSVGIAIGYAWGGRERRPSKEALAEAAVVLAERLDRTIDERVAAYLSADCTILDQAEPGTVTPEERQHEWPKWHGGL